METLNKHLAEYKRISAEIDPHNREEIRQTFSDLENYVGVIEMDEQGWLHCGSSTVPFTYCKDLIGKMVQISFITLNKNKYSKDIYPTFAKHVEVLEQALGIRKKALGAEHPDTATVYNNIGAVYYGQGDYAQALKYFMCDLAIQKKESGMDHPNTATAYNNIGLCYSKKGDPSLAIKYYLKDLAISEKVLGTDHPDTATSYHNIGLAYKAKGENEQALMYFQKALEIREKMLGAEHPDTKVAQKCIDYLTKKSDE